MFPAQIAFVIGDTESADQIASQMTPATLYEHKRLAVRGVRFPAVVAAAAVCLSDPSMVEGLLVFDLSDSQRLDLDRYESGLYNLMPVEVWIEVVDAGEEGSVRQRRMAVEAEVYVWAEPRDELVEVAEKEWSVEEYWDR